MESSSIILDSSLVTLSSSIVRVLKNQKLQLEAFYLKVYNHRLRQTTLVLRWNGWAAIHHIHTNPEGLTFSCDPSRINNVHAKQTATDKEICCRHKHKYHTYKGRQT